MLLFIIFKASLKSISSGLNIWAPSLIAFLAISSNCSSFTPASFSVVGRPQISFSSSRSLYIRSIVLIALLLFGVFAIISSAPPQKGATVSPMYSSDLFRQCFNPNGKK